MFCGQLKSYDKSMVWLSLMYGKTAHAFESTLGLHPSHGIPGILCTIDNALSGNYV